MLNPARSFMSLHSFTRKAIFWIASGGCAGLLSGCQGALSTPIRPQVRVIDVSPDAPEVDIYQNSSAIAYKLNYGTITSYVPVETGANTTAATMSGTRQALATSKAKFAAAEQYTVLIGNYSSNLQQVLLKDQSQPAPPGKIALRLIDQATQAGAADVYLVPAGKKLSSVTPLVTGTTYNANTGYLNLAAGSYTLVVVPAGTVETNDGDTLYTGAQVSYESGSASTVVLVDQRKIGERPGVQAILAQDYVPASAE
jgi:hypothetical protein